MDKENINNEKIIGTFKTPKIFYPFIIIISILIIVMFFIFFKIQLPNSIKTPSKSQEQTVADIFIVVFFILIVLGLCIILLPNFKEIRSLFGQISNVTYVIIYTIFLIFLFTLTPSNILNSYAYIITPLTVLLGILSFYKSTTTDYVANFDVNYERIKMIILLFCLLACYIIFYNTDPGGYISKYFGYTLLLTIIIAVFGFLYLVILLTLPDSIKPNIPGVSSNNFLQNFSSFSVYGSISFLIFIIVMTFLISYYPGGFFNDKATSSAVMILLLLICILWSTLLVGNLFSDFSIKSVNINKISLFKKSLLALFGILISGLIIFWLTESIQNLSGQSGTVSFILNTLLVVIFLGLVYKVLNIKTPSGNSKKSGFFNIITNFILYIPCLFSNIFDSIGKTIVGEYRATTAGSIMMLLFAITIFIVYFSMPYIYNTVGTQGGKLLVNNPVYTNTQYSLGTYQELNGSDNYDYQYGLSCWIYIDSAPPNTNPSYETYTSLLNFGNKPNILYNGKTNTLMITIQQKDLQNTTTNDNINFDKNGNRIIYIKHNVLLQKWNNIIINYEGGVLDIFLNGELVKSNIEVVPYYTLDSLTIGENDGVQGGICNVVYFRKALTATNIFYLYNASKNKNPPTTKESNESILQNNLNTLSSST